MKTFIQVEYDPQYEGGSYSSVGQFVLIPSGTKDIERVFERKTKLSRRRIVHYSPDELYDKNGNPVELQ